MIKYEDTNENWYLTACQFVQNPSHFLAFFRFTRSYNPLCEQFYWRFMLIWLRKAIVDPAADRIYFTYIIKWSRRNDLVLDPFRAENRRFPVNFLSLFMALRKAKTLIYISLKTFLSRSQINDSPKSNILCTLYWYSPWICLRKDAIIGCFDHR